ncbi:SpoIIE family protein phosphatase [Modestobacter roseus]|uniref:Serine phosphatase RsbU (Regulator of sigma subunit) n=1 Tax=Modestobacter roseus TaxID=1181884 RepID=A0A562IVA2_9ACTN|nr:SpoIIE family protein phosphatase [Modestobacter roseus]MQA35711.1 SpoIIE family protein phosphatase [Modestobacter roseus]TWH74878.1 serine phosphatase RsbU (regulator of sigma subunit) [Modestobacter roseus]
MTPDGAAPSADLLVQAVGAMPRPLFVLDEDWRFSYVNPAGAQLLQRRVEDLVGRVIWAEFPEAVGSEFAGHYEHVARTGEPVAFESWYPPLRTWFHVDAFATAAGLVVTYDDVTQRRATEQARADAVAAREEEAERAAEAAHAAELAGRHLMLLGDVSQAMTATLDTGEAVQRLAELIVPPLADWCLVSVVEDGVRRDVGRAHRDPAMVPHMHRYADLRARTNQATAPVPTALRDGRPVVIQGIEPRQVEAMTTPAAREALAPLRVHSVATFPLVARGELFGAVTLVTGPERGAFTDAELRTADIMSRRAGLALDNARLAAAQTRVAERLQRSLLSPPVQPDHLELAVRYRPAAQDVSIGGDWYDSFLQPDGATVLVIGDVMGHDLEAAATMAELRTLVRAIAYDRQTGPGEVLRRVDRAVVGLQVASLATALVARIEMDDADRAAGLRRLRWAVAGHPMPLLVLPDGTVTDLEAPVGPPLGLGLDLGLPERDGARGEGLTVLPPDSTLLLFTDGLFERRTSDLDAGRERLRAAASRLAGEPLDRLADGLLAELLADGAEDDVALLAVRCHPVV